MELNFKPTVHGETLYMSAKIIRIEGEELSAEQTQRVCSILSKTYGIAATPYKFAGRNCLITQRKERVPDRRISIDQWTVQLIDNDERVHLKLDNLQNRHLMGELYKRRIIRNATRVLNLWSFDSPRILYQPFPFTNSAENTNKDIDAYYRFEISDIYVDKIGLTTPVNIGVSYFSNITVDDYFLMGKTERFYQLIARQSEHKGTLLYDGPKGKVKCHFERYVASQKLSETSAFSISGKHYANSYDYFHQEYPKFNVSPDDRVAYVSFPGIKGASAVPVPANRLTIRVMNAQLDYDLNQNDKIPPSERARLLSDFWKALGSNAYGENYDSVKESFYTTNTINSGIIAIPTITFGQNTTLEPPKFLNKKEYTTTFKQRKRLLDDFGCYYVPPAMSRDIYLIFPQRIQQVIKDDLTQSIIKKVSKLTRIQVEPTVLTYDNYLEAALQLKKEYEPAMAVFIFESQDPDVYFNISYELNDWHIKRITDRELSKKHRGLQAHRKGQNPKGERNWQSFIDLCAYDIVQQLGCIPFVIAPNLYYDMQLVIDVSEKSSHFVLSLFIWKDGMRAPISQVRIKGNPDRKETINSHILKKNLTELFENCRNVLVKNQPVSLLILRDGRDCGDEFAAIKSVINELKSKVLSESFAFDFIEYHKTSQKEIRMWDNINNTKDNVLEGSYFMPNDKTALLATTGAGTLNQGTAAPILLHSKHTDCDLRRVVHDVFISSQMNFSSPSVAQKLTYPAKKADELLKERRAQEVERTR